MITTQTHVGLLDLLASMIDYPLPELPDRAQECAAAFEAGRSPGARDIERFARFVAQTDLNKLEELYTATFELSPVCYPYIGYQLFGDTYKRGEFLAQLNARYRENGFEAPGDLPDHLGAILRYLAHTWDADLVAEGAIPSLEKMVAQLEANPYVDLLRAILAVLRKQ